jgi:hypothetical protein
MVRFRNAQELHRLYPETFEVPTAKQLVGIEAGSYVKVSVEFPENVEGMDGERFWVEVLEREGNRLRGRVGNELVATADHGLNLGDQIAFSIENVYEIAV